MPLLRTLLIGHGYSGRRFARTLHYIQRCHAELRMECAIAERSSARLAGIYPGWQVYASAEQAYEHFRPNIIVVCVNEECHFEVLNAVPTYGRLCLLCEKPLTATLSETVALSTVLAPHEVYVNLVERYSTVLTPFKNWLNEQQQLTLRRAEFFWGKDRIADARPTIGVMSEIVHPLDLIDFVFGLRDGTVVDAIGIASDFATPFGDRRLDSVDIVLNAGGASVIGHSSFVWGRRQRLITAFLSNARGGRFRVVMDFDTPCWDCDSVEVVRLDGEGSSRPTVFRATSSNREFPQELFEVFKVYEFVRTSIESFLSKRQCVMRVDVPQSIRIQGITDSIEATIRGAGGPIVNSLGLEDEIAPIHHRPPTVASRQVAGTPLG